MRFEDDIFKRKIPDYNKLILYGFINDGVYKYTTNILDDFKVIITVSSGKVNGKIYDLKFNEEYINYRIENQNGSFVNKVREEYIKLLKDISDKCFITSQFICKQANRISNLIYEKYKDKPIFKFSKYPGFGIFENNSKWYGLIANIDRSKLDKQKGEVEIINLKVDSHKIPLLLKKNGFYEAYHMNKKNWISIILDDTLKDDEIMDLIDESYSFTVNLNKSKNEWVIPVNAKYFDVRDYFNSNDIIVWNKKANYLKGDYVFIYLTKPYSSIMYKCKVIEINVYDESDIMKLKIIEKYNKEKYNLEFLKKYGLSSIRGPRHIPLKLSKVMEEK